MSTDAAYDNLVGIVDRIVDDKVGLISVLEEVRPEPGAPNFFHFRARASDTSAFARETNFRDSGGAATTRDAAMAKAIGEAIERYSPALFDVEQLPLFAWRDARSAAVPPGEFALYADDQYAEPGFPWLPFRDDTVVRWTPATDLHSRAEILVPACRVFMPYNYYLGSGDTPIDQPISTGLACHASYAKAARVAFCEVIERDAVMITWQAAISPPAIRIETLPDDLYDLVQRFESKGLKVDMFDITTDNEVPTILSTLRGLNPAQAALVVAAAASLDAAEAARKSLEELAHTRRYCQWVKTHAARLVPDPPAFECVVDQMTHLGFYVDQHNLHYASFLFASDRGIDFEVLHNRASGDEAADLDALVSAIAATGERPLIADLTSSDVASLGISVVRAIVPGYQPLHMGFQLRSRGGRRLYDVPQRLGHRGIRRGEADNPAPHPYP